ncbi:hypothetical protein HanRHA438_Chr02g0063261 [Helianthus annuus]|nr:hypothetical protein HanRHA438_Chr02g0063261 [Helianthus annuus]
MEPNSPSHLISPNPVSVALFSFLGVKNKQIRYPILIYRVALNFYMCGPLMALCSSTALSLFRTFYTD